MIYVDPSALVKLLVAEAGSDAVRSLISSGLTSGTKLIASRQAGLELSRCEA